MIAKFQSSKLKSPLTTSSAITFDSNYAKRIRIIRKHGKLSQPESGDLRSFRTQVVAGMHAEVIDPAVRRHA